MSAEATPIIIAEDIGVVFGNTPALRGVSFDVRRGERVLIQGHNGAGKSTLIRVLAGLLRPDRGSLTIDGLSARDPEIRRLIGVVVHNPWLDPDLTVVETLHYYAALYHLTRIDHQIDASLESVGMQERKNQRVGELSRGYQQRLTLARALQHNPDILLLDEPDTGLDESTLETISVLLHSRTVVMTSHNRAFGESLANRALEIANGRLLEPVSA